MPTPLNLIHIEATSVYPESRNIVIVMPGLSSIADIRRPISAFLDMSYKVKELIYSIFVMDNYVVSV